VLKYWLEEKVYESLKGTHPQCIAFDPNNPNRAYCGTFGGGLWKTDDSGGGWDNIGKEILSSKDVMSVSVSHLEREGSYGFNTVYVGTEPTAIYRSDDGGRTWIDRVQGGPYDTHTMSTQKDAWMVILYCR
jgi:photosystem II stability/assembly factor-like uncharacterized protein